LVPITENDFNNFQDTVFDKFNRPGYLIYINKYYIFQPFDENQDVPMYYRSTYDRPMRHSLTLHNYIKNTAKYQEIKGEKTTKKDDLKKLEKGHETYDFESIMEYYDNRDEFKFVGIIDKQISRRKIKSQDELQDVFKIREKRSKILEKKRGTGIPSLKGAVCSTSKDKEYLESLAKSISITKEIKSTDTRSDICNKIKERLLFLEKYSTAKKSNKLTYIMIPANHPDYKFPYNLEDRVKYIYDKIKDKIKFKLDMKTKTVKAKVKSVDKTEDVDTYVIEINADKKLEDFADFLKSLDGKLVKGKWTILVN
jgi:hypothetical protein